jgi:hypothetical protein
MNELLVTVTIQYNKNDVKKLNNKVNTLRIAYETDKTTSRCEVCTQDRKENREIFINFHQDMKFSNSIIT